MSKLDASIASAFTQWTQRVEKDGTMAKAATKWALMSDEPEAKIIRELVGSSKRAKQNPPLSGKDERYKALMRVAVDKGWSEDDVIAKLLDLMDDEDVVVCGLDDAPTRAFFGLPADDHYASQRRIATEAQNDIFECLRHVAGWTKEKTIRRMLAVLEKEGVVKREEDFSEFF